VCWKSTDVWEGTCRLYLQGWRVRQAKIQHEETWQSERTQMVNVLWCGRYAACEGSKQVRGKLWLMEWNTRLMKIVSSKMREENQRAPSRHEPTYFDRNTSWLWSPSSWARITISFSDYVMSYKRQGQCLIPGRSKRLSVLQNIKSSSGAHPASYPMDTGGSFPGGKATKAWSWPLTSI
jgi:hypothetical protein